MRLIYKMKPSQNFKSKKHTKLTKKTQLKTKQSKTNAHIFMLLFEEKKIPGNGSQTRNLYSTNIVIILCINK